jgi:hypothetical protein
VRARARVGVREGWGLWCDPLSRARFVQGDSKSGISRQVSGVRSPLLPFIRVRARARVGVREGWGLWCYSLFRTRFSLGDFVEGGGDGAQENRDGTGIAQKKPRHPGGWIPGLVRP